MTDLQEKAMRMALERLESHEYWMDEEALQVLRQALAQPESDCYGYASRLATYIWEKHYKEDSPEWKPLDSLEGVLTQIDNMVCGLVKAQSEQEPVAWVDITDEGKWSVRFAIPALSLSDGTKFYTTPPKREWVGLTDEESIKLLQKAAKHKSPDYCTAPEMAVEFGRLASESLKEKNT